MNVFKNVKIGRKLLLMSIGALLQLLLIAGLSLQALNDSNAAAEKAQHYAHKMDLAEKMDSWQLEMGLLLANLSDSRQREADVARVAAIEKDYRGEIEYFKQSASTDEDRKLVGEIERAFSEWESATGDTLTSVRGVKPAKTAGALSAMRTATAAYLGYRQKRVDTFQQEQRATVSKVQTMIVGFALFALVGGLVFSRLVSTSITTPLSQVLKNIVFVSEGDVTRDVPEELLSRKDEIGTLSGAVRDMSRSLRLTIGGLTEGAGVLSSASAELSATSGQMSAGSRTTSDRAHHVAAAAVQLSASSRSVASGMERTAASLNSVSAATEEMTATIGEIAGNSEKARRITEQASRQAHAVTEQMNQLGDAAKEIGKVTETITEISSQTNLLALNAAIEAARAGNAGKGFAVVASEIKALAQQAAAATEDIREKIARVQTSTTGGILEIGRISGVIVEVSQIVGSIAAAIEEQSVTTRSIAQNIAEASNGAAESNRHVAESSQASSEIAKEIAAVDDATGQIAAGSEQVRISATELSTVAEGLQATVRRFKV
jgi:methyl-accepting chemotaxis protein